MAQTPDAQTAENAAETTSSPVAHVYLGAGTQILAFSAAANGELTPVLGSPFPYNTSVMGANGHYLFGFEPNSVVIDSLSMAANGSLKKVATTNTDNFSNCPLTYQNGQGLRIDHSGQNLYNGAIGEGVDQGVWCNMNFQSFKIDESNGELTFLGAAGDIGLGGNSQGVGGNAQLGILGNNKFAYYPWCYHANGYGPVNGVTVFERLSTGDLSSLEKVDVNLVFPDAPEDIYNPNGQSWGYYCPLAVATDPTDHLAMTFYANDYTTTGTGAPYGPIAIGTFTANSKGYLSTSSTYKNMATLPVDSNYNGHCLACAALRMSPSGKLLAAGGPAGVLLFHFNGGSPVTKYKTLLANENVSSILWDNNNHMYVLGSDANGAKLWVYTVTPTSVTEAPGSPYSTANAASMVVHTL